MITKPKKHRTRVPGVSVTLSTSGGFTVTATAAAVKRWPWDGSSWPCANLHRAHRFTFEANGDLCDMETKQKDSRDGANGEAVSALAEDCRTLAAEVKARLETPPPAKKVSKIKEKCKQYLGNRGVNDRVKRAAFFDGLWFIIFADYPEEVEVCFSCYCYEPYTSYPAKGFDWSKGNLAKIKAKLETIK